MAQNRPQAKRTAEREAFLACSAQHFAEQWYRRSDQGRDQETLAAMVLGLLRKHCDSTEIATRSAIADRLADLAL